LRHASRIALMERELYAVFIFLVKNTSIQRLTIPTEAWKVLEHSGYRKLSFDPKKTVSVEDKNREGVL